jgi:hypothetical protein
MTENTHANSQKRDRVRIQLEGEKMDFDRVCALAQTLTDVKAYRKAGLVWQGVIQNNKGAFDQHQIQQVHM